MRGRDSSRNPGWKSSCLGNDGRNMDSRGLSSMPFPERRGAVCTRMRYPVRVLCTWFESRVWGIPRNGLRVLVLSRGMTRVGWAGSGTSILATTAEASRGDPDETRTTRPKGQGVRQEGERRGVRASMRRWWPVGVSVTSHVVSITPRKPQSPPGNMIDYPIVSCGKARHD